MTESVQRSQVIGAAWEHLYGEYGTGDVIAYGFDLYFDSTLVAGCRFLADIDGCDCHDGLLI
jgi:hypothetical protein